MAFVQGIDVGTWKVRVATMEGSFRRWAHRDVVEVESRSGAEAALDSIRAMEPAWNQCERVAALPLDRATVRVVRLPFTDRSTVAKALPAEVESSVPYELDDMVLATALVDQEKGSSRTRVVIARQEDVAAQLQLLRNAQSEPRSLVLDAEALSQYADRGVQAIVDFGHSRTLLALCHNGQLLSARAIPLGGLQLTEAVASVTGLDLPDAEAMKHELRVPTEAGQPWVDEPTDSGVVRNAAAERVVTAGVDELAAELRARLIALEDELGLGVDEILYAGGAAQLAGLPERVAMATGVPVRPVLVSGGHPGTCALAVALARIAADEAKAIDLRVGAFAYRGHAEILWSVVSYGALATAAALLLGTLYVGYRVTQTWDDISALDEKISAKVLKHFPDVSPDRLTDTSTALAIFSERAQEVQARVDALGAVVSGDPPMLSMVKRVSDAMPPNAAARVDVRELNVTETSVNMKAETDSYESAAKIEESLKANEAFTQTRKSDEKKLGDVLTFNLSIPLGAPEPESTEPAATPAGEEG